MASELEIEMATMIRDKLVAAMDKITTSTIDVLADIPRTEAGQIRDPYWRGFMDGATIIADGLRTGFEQAVQDISEH